MTDHIHPSDKADALRWAERFINLALPGGPNDLTRTRLYILRELAREAEQEARR